MPEIQIRLAQTDDLAQILDLYACFESKDPPPAAGLIEQTWRDMLSAAHIAVIIAEDQARIVSTCTLIVIPNLNHSARAYGLIENVVTSPDFRGRGIATRVLKFALNLAWDINCYKVMLMTGSKKEETLRFYEKAGFLRGVKTGFIAYPP
jgi:GNAT superfamily N-acetyltransferase